MRALITGVTGQDGSYLAEHLHAEGWHVAGLVRGQQHPKREWLRTLVPGIHLVDGDLLDQSSLQDALKVTRPDVVFNLGALTFVGMSWQQPALMTEVTGLGALRMLEAIRMVNPEIRFVQASSSEMFGGVKADYMDESTPLKPRSPYGTAKAFAHNTTVNYRESYGMHASCAIMFNHESTRRGYEFVTRKVSRAVAMIYHGKATALSMGRLDTMRDWGWAPDFVQALPLMASCDQPRDYVLATGEAHTVEDLCERAFGYIGYDWRDYVTHDSHWERPADVDYLRGNPAEAFFRLGWRPDRYFGRIVDELVAHDLDELRERP